METTMNSRAHVSAAHWAQWLPHLWAALGVLALGAGIAASRPAAAQEAPSTAEIASADELAELVGPIALYPDDLVAIVLPASTYPLQVVQAARFIEDRKRDSSLQPEDDWDDSIVALLNYPEVVELLNDDLDWTYDLGTAVLNQRADVLNAIQGFRDRAYAAGNLRTDDRQTVSRDDGAIKIEPANPQVIYVPYYEPERVVVYQPVPVYRYYPRRYPVYYYPYPSHYVFDTGYFWGVRSWFSIGWHSHHVHVYDWHYHNHPYYGWSYYDPWFVRNVYVNVNRNRDYVWEPRHRYGGRPVVRGNEGRVYNGEAPPARVGGGMAGGAYRSRSVESTQEAREAAEVRQPRRGVLADPNRSTTVAPRTESNVYRGTTTRQVPSARAPSEDASPAPQRVYRSGGGMSQALERQRAQPSQPARAAAPPRSLQESTGMPREASRGVETRSIPQQRAPAPAEASRAPSGGGMGQAQRSGGTYRGGDSGGGDSGGGDSGGGDSGGGNSAGSNSGGGRSHPAARERGGAAR
jgi:hypothetical protein